ncbi:MAG: hypothetical protein ACKODM_06725 [Cytophagales bacterium]
MGKQLENAGNVSKDMDKYQKDLGNITKDGLNDDKLKKEMEGKAANMAGGKALEGQLSDIENKRRWLKNGTATPSTAKSWP